MKPERRLYTVFCTRYSVDTAVDVDTRHSTDRVAERQIGSFKLNARDGQNHFCVARM